MALLADFVFFCIFIFILARSSAWTIRSISKISAFLRIGEFTSGFIILAFATTLPELLVGINSAIANTPALSLGNVLGSNIANLTLILGIVILVGRGIKIKSKFIRKDSFYILLIAALPIFLMLDHELSRVDGVALIITFIIYIFKIKKERKKYENKINHATGYEMFNNIALFILGILVLLISANFVVRFGINLAQDLNVAPILIGLFLIAIGTSIPELVLGIRSALSGHEELSVGDLLGAVAINSTLVLGITALIRPILTHYTIFITSAFFMLGACLLVLLFVHFDKKITIKEGLILLLFYIIFTIIEIGLNGLI